MNYKTYIVTSLFHFIHCNTKENKNKLVGGAWNLLCVACRLKTTMAVKTGCICWVCFCSGYDINKQTLAISTPIPVFVKILWHPYSPHHWGSLQIKGTCLLLFWSYQNYVSQNPENKPMGPMTIVMFSNSRLSPVNIIQNDLGLIQIHRISKKHKKQW